MRRGAVITLVMMGLLVGLLASGLAWVGTHLDYARIERDDLQFEVEDLKQTIDAMAKEREDLRTQMDSQSELVEQLNAELARTRQLVTTLKGELQEAKRRQQEPDPEEVLTDS